jgi:hypothetical protein
MSFVVPASSTHFPKYSSPKKGLRGFFSVPYSSLRLLYCCLRVLINHLSTSRARLAGSCSLAGATKMEGCSAQYDENSTKEVDDRIQGGAVKEERSPLKLAMVYQAPEVRRALTWGRRWWWGRGKQANLQKRAPRALLGRRNLRGFGGGRHCSSGWAREGGERKVEKKRRVRVWWISYFQTAVQPPESRARVQPAVACGRRHARHPAHHRPRGIPPSPAPGCLCRSARRDDHAPLLREGGYIVGYPL